MSTKLPALSVSDAAFSGDLRAAQASASTPRPQSAAATAGSAVAHSKLRSTTTRRQLGYGTPLSQASCDNATFVWKVAVVQRLREVHDPQISVALYVDETGFRETCEDVGVDLAMGVKHKPELAKLPKE